MCIRDRPNGYTDGGVDNFRFTDTVSSSNTPKAYAQSQDIPVGIDIHNVEIQPGAGGKIARAAGSSVTISGIDGNYSIIKMTSGEVRKIDSRALATIGVLSNPDQKNIKIGKAGRSRWLGRRPHTRGVVKNPVDHPHGGGEGKSAGGRHPVSPLSLIHI